MTRAGCDVLSLQLKGYRLAMADITYHLPDHPGVLQSFIWQHYDLAPDYPKLRSFLDFWTKNIEGKIHSVTVGRRHIVAPSSYKHAAGIFKLH